MSRLVDLLKIQLLRFDIARRRAGVYIVSYPKSGRTWLRVLIGKAVCAQSSLPEELMLDTYRLTAAAGLRPTYFTHDYSEILTALPYHRLPTTKTEYARSRIIFVVRDVKDVLVSSYFQATRRTHRFKGSVSEFIRSDRFGARKIVTFYNIWHQNRHIPEEFVLIRYEDMHRDPAEALARALRAIGVAQIDGATLRDAVAFGSFEHMKEMEISGFFNDPRMRPGDANDEESFKVRKGLVGGHTAYLEEDDIRYIESTIAELSCPFVQAQPVALNGLPSVQFANS